MNSSSHQTADTFSAAIPFDVLPAGMTPDDLSRNAPLAASIEATNDILAGGLTELIKGTIDQVDLDFVQKIATISGRDLAAGMIDTKSTEEWINHTTAAIVKDIAGRHGLSAVITNGTTKAGLAYVDDFNQITDSDTEWDLLIKLAKREGATVFVKGTKVYFQPLGMASSGTFKLIYSPALSGPPSGNFITLRCVRDLTLAKTVKAKVSGWNAKSKKAITSIYQAAGAAGTLQYEHRGGNLNKAQTDLIAQSIVAQNINLERSVQADVPGDVSIDARMKLSLSGTGTSFDQTYSISEISHRFSQTEGYRMSISCQAADQARTVSKVQ